MKRDSAHAGVCELEGFGYECALENNSTRCTDFLPSFAVEGRAHSGECLRTSYVTPLLPTTFTKCGDECIWGNACPNEDVGSCDDCSQVKIGACLSQDRVFCSVSAASCGEAPFLTHEETAQDHGVACFLCPRPFQEEGDEVQVGSLGDSLSSTSSSDQTVIVVAVCLSLVIIGFFGSVFFYLRKQRTKEKPIKPLKTLTIGKVDPESDIEDDDESMY